MSPAFIDQLLQEHKQCTDCPPRESVAFFFQELMGLLFADFATKKYKTEIDIEQQFTFLKENLTVLLKGNKQAVEDFFSQLPKVKELLEEDAQALTDGDPAALSKQLVIRSYPGFYATAAYRIAHALLPFCHTILPRMITEHAHSVTGIDINPKAQIGRRLCIDHGTGVVIGETAIIGNDVKIYQGVTLGALSVHKKDAHTKRHPTIEDHVIIYAGATILGGETIVGKHSVIGGNVWLTKSVPPHSKIYYQAKMANISNQTEEVFVFKSNE